MEPQNFKVLAIGTGSVLVSYIEVSPLETLRYIVLLVTLGYTLYKWYKELR